MTHQPNAPIPIAPPDIDPAAAAHLTHTVGFTDYWLVEHDGHWLAWTRGPVGGDTVLASPHHDAAHAWLQEEVAAHVRTLNLPDPYVAIQNLSTGRLVLDIAVHLDLTWGRYWFLGTDHQCTTATGRTIGLESFDTSDAATRQWQTAVSGAAHAIPANEPYGDILAAHLNACVARADLTLARRRLGQAICRQAAGIQSRGDLSIVAHGLGLEPDALWEVCRGKRWT